MNRQVTDNDFKRAVPEVREYVDFASDSSPYFRPKNKVKVLPFQSLVLSGLYQVRSEMKVVWLALYWGARESQICVKRILKGCLCSLSLRGLVMGSSLYTGNWSVSYVVI